MFTKVARQRLDGHPVDAGGTLVLADSLERSLQVAWITNLLHQKLGSRRTPAVVGRPLCFGPFSTGGQGFTLLHRLEGQLQLVFLPLDTSAAQDSDLPIYPSDARGGPFGPSCRPFPPRATPTVSPLSGECPDRVGRRHRPTMPSADFCLLLARLIPGEPGRSLGVSSTAFLARPPDLQPRPLMDMDFVVNRPLVRPDLPPIRFLFVGSRVCSALPSDGPSRDLIGPCASLALRLHQAVQGTFTPKLLSMPDTRLSRPVGPVFIGALTP